MISYISYHIYYISYTHRSPEVTASMRWFSSRLSLMMLIQISLVMMFGNNALMTMIGIMIIANICLPIFQRHIALYWPCRLVGRWLMSPLIFLHIYRPHVKVPPTLIWWTQKLDIMDIDMVDMGKVQN